MSEPNRRMKVQIIHPWPPSRFRALLAHLRPETGVRKP
ncbi:hypothetical protein RKD49_003799 [Streptomyces glaucescens]